VVLDGVCLWQVQECAFATDLEVRSKYTKDAKLAVNRGAKPIEGAGAKIY